MPTGAHKGPPYRPFLVWRNPATKSGENPISPKNPIFAIFQIFLIAKS